MGANWGQASKKIFNIFRSRHGFTRERNVNDDGRSICIEPTTILAADDGDAKNA